MCSALVLVTIALAGAPKVEKIRIAVPDMTLSGVDDNLGRILTEIVTTEISNLEGVGVIGSSDIKTMLGFEQQRLLLGGTDEPTSSVQVTPVATESGVALVLHGSF